MFTAPHTFSRSRAVERMIKRGVRPELVFGQAELSENAQLAIQAAIREVTPSIMPWTALCHTLLNFSYDPQANRTGQTHVGTEMLLWALFQKTKHDSEARYWLANMGVLGQAAECPLSEPRILTACLMTGLDCGAERLDGFVGWARADRACCRLDRENAGGGWAGGGVRMRRDAANHLLENSGADPHQIQRQGHVQGQDVPKPALNTFVSQFVSTRFGIYRDLS